MIGFGGITSVSILTRQMPKSAWGPFHETYNFTKLQPVPSARAAGGQFYNLSRSGLGQSFIFLLQTGLFLPVHLVIDGSPFE